MNYDQARHFGVEVWKMRLLKWVILGPIFGRGTSYVQTPGEQYIHGKSEVPPEATHKLCGVGIIVRCARQSVEVVFPLETTIVMLSSLRVKAISLCHLYENISCHVKALYLSHKR